MNRWHSSHSFPGSQEYPARTGRFTAVLLTLGSIGLWLLISSLLLSLGGCVHLAGALTGSQNQKAMSEEEVRYRQEYLETRSAEAMSWLVVNRLKNGMSKFEVDNVFGEGGEREYNDSRILREAGSGYRADDFVYRWGPDRDGNVYMFVFRDDRLMNVEGHLDELKKLAEPRVSFSLSSDDF